MEFRDRAEVVAYGKALREDYERRNRPAAETVIGEPMQIAVGEQTVYCLHYPSKRRKNGPVFFNIHGGGMVWAYPEEDDSFCANVNETLDIEVYSLDYLRAPEHMYPEAVELLYRTLVQFAQSAARYNFDPAQMAIGGHSAGGNFAAALTLMAAARGDVRFACQVLDYPAVDMRPSAFTEEACALMPSLPKSLLDYFSLAYMKESDADDPYCNPIVAAPEQLRGLPPAVVMTCERDPLKYMGRAYTQKLIEANVPVLHYEYPGVEHAFDVFEGPEMKKGQDYLIRGLKFFMGL